MNVYDRIIVLFPRSFFGFDSFIYSFLAFLGIVYCKDQDDDDYVLVPFMLLVVVVLAPHLTDLYVVPILSFFVAFVYHVLQGMTSKK